MIVDSLWLIEKRKIKRSGSTDGYGFTRMSSKSFKRDSRGRESMIDRGKASIKAGITQRHKDTEGRSKTVNHERLELHERVIRLGYRDKRKSKGKSIYPQITQMDADGD